jgi:hypothetical protein
MVGYKMFYTPPQDFFRPSSSMVKYLSHLWFFSDAQASNSNEKILFNLSNNHCGVSQLSVAELNIPLVLIFHHHLNQV